MHLLFALGLSLGIIAVPMRVYHCVIEEVPTYSDRPCSDPGTEPLTLTVVPATPVQFAPLDDADKRALRALDTRLANAATDRAKKLARLRQRRQRDRAASDKACNSARSALERLEAQRRKGYRLNEAGKLEAAESQHIEVVRQHCR